MQTVLFIIILLVFLCWVEWRSFAKREQQRAAEYARKTFAEKVAYHASMLNKVEPFTGKERGAMAEIMARGREKPAIRDADIDTIVAILQKPAPDSTDLLATMRYSMRFSLVDATVSSYSFTPEQAARLVPVVAECCADAASETRYSNIRFCCLNILRYLRSDVLRSEARRALRDRSRPLRLAAKAYLQELDGKQ